MIPFNVTAVVETGPKGDQIRTDAVMLGWPTRTKGKATHCELLLASGRNTLAPITDVEALTDAGRELLTYVPDARPKA